jgi:hypothetical protein
MASGTSGSLAQRLRVQARRTVDRVDTEAVRRARGMVRQLRKHPPDVVYIGESTAQWVGPADVDRRRLRVMVGDALPTGVSYFATAGGSFHTDLIEHYVRLIGCTGARPLLLLPLWMRGRFVPWIEHPIFGHKRAMAALSRVRPGTPTWRIRAGLPRPAAHEWDEFYALPVETLAGRRSIGEYVRPLKSPAQHGLTADDRERLIYAYHQGGRLEYGSPALAAVERLGSRVAQLGSRVVLYQTPLCLAVGEHHWGPEFGELVRNNFDVLARSFATGFGAEVPVLETGTMFGADEFINASWADEHLNEVGRRRLADLLAGAVLTELRR